MSSKKSILITGVTGQDGSYLADKLIQDDCTVYGLIRRSSVPNTWRIDHLLYGDASREGRFVLLEADLCDELSLLRVLEEVQPAEIYNMAAQSHVASSFRIPDYTVEATGLSAIRLLSAIHTLQLPCRFYQASSSEMFGKVREVPQKETTPFYPRSPYGVAKLLAHQTVRMYRENHGLFACSGILFNHESPRRGENFVTRKITLGVARIVAGISNELTLGNLDAQRDWGFAGEYMDAVIKMLRAEQPKDYVIATGETHSVQAFLEEVFRLVDLNPKDWVRTDPRFLRPAEVDMLIGDASLAKIELQWEATVKYKKLARLMLEEDLHRLGRQL
jgi:GDPmannose 4,6-dehydratase